jgi:hypothetical protein
VDVLLRRVYEPRATLGPSEGHSAFAVLAQLTHRDIDRPYTKDWFGFPDEYVRHKEPFAEAS